MNANLTTAGRIAWQELVPSTIIFRSLGIACSIPVIVLSLLGVVAIPMGWIVSESLFIGDEKFRDDNPILAELAEMNRSPYRAVFRVSDTAARQPFSFARVVAGPQSVFDQSVRPFYALFGGARTTREYLYFLFGGLWSIAVWSFVGLGIARVSLLRLTRNERAGLDDAFDYARDYFSTSILALLTPIAIAFAICIPTFLLGLMLGFDLGALIVGLIWFVVLMFGLALGLLLLGLMFSWPLIISSVAAEGQNSLDAVTRCYSYVFQRPVHFAVYCLIALVFGGVCWLVAVQFTDAVIRLSFWSTGWGANRVAEHRIELFKDPNAISGFENYARFNSYGWADESAKQEVNEDSQTNRFNPAADPSSKYLFYSRKLIGFWIGFARTVAAAFIHGLFWSMATAIYLLLRKDLDETEMDEIFVVEEQRTYELPPLKSDQFGVPQIQPLPDDTGNGQSAID